VQSVESQPQFWRNTSPSSSVMLATCFKIVSCFAYSSILKMDFTGSSDTSVELQGTKRCYIPEDRTLHNHRCENLKSYIRIELPDM
jgi:hypothetical protein